MAGAEVLNGSEDRGLLKLCNVEPPIHQPDFGHGRWHEMQGSASSVLEGV